jgi:hypothetical protein
MNKNIVKQDKVLAGYAKQIRSLLKRTVKDVIKIGMVLTRAKDRAGHGNWLPWLDAEFGWSHDTASNFMRVFEFSKTPPFRKVRNLPTSVLYLLAKAPEAVRDSVIDRAEAGEKITTADLRPPPKAVEMMPAGEIRQASAALSGHAASSEVESFEQLAAAMPEAQRSDHLPLPPSLTPKERSAFQARQRFSELIHQLIYVREAQLIGSEDRAAEDLVMAREVLAQLEGRHDLEKVREMMNFIEAAWPKSVVLAFERHDDDEPPDAA